MSLRAACGVGAAVDRGPHGRSTRAAAPHVAAWTGLPGRRTSDPVIHVPVVRVVPGGCRGGRRRFRRRTGWSRYRRWPIAANGEESLPPALDIAARVAPHRLDEAAAQPIQDPPPHPQHLAAASGTDVARGARRRGRAGAESPRGTDVEGRSAPQRCEHALQHGPGPITFDGRKIPISIHSIGA